MSSETLQQRQAGIARASRKARRTGDPADSEHADYLRREYAEQKLAEHIRRVVDGFPPLSDEQRARLAALLQPGRH